MAGQAFKKFLPLFDRVLVERSAAETVTKGGIMLPEKLKEKYCKQQQSLLDQVLKERMERFNQLAWQLESEFSQNIEAPK